MSDYACPRHAVRSSRWRATTVETRFKNVSPFFHSAHAGAGVRGKGPITSENTPLTHESTCDAESNFKRLLSTTKPPFFDRAANEQLTRQQCLASRLDLRRGTSSPSVSWLRVPLSARGCVSALFSGILREGLFRRNDSLTVASFQSYSRRRSVLA